jgi:hypothetical protein
VPAFFGPPQVGLFISEAAFLAALAAFNNTIIIYTNILLLEKYFMLNIFNL